jgi:DNA-binding MarR family transcriptional regulator
MILKRAKAGGFLHESSRLSRFFCGMTVAGKRYNHEQDQYMQRPSTTAQAEKMAEVTFRLLDQCQEKQERIAKSVGLTTAEFRLLRTFRDATDLNVGELARRMELSNSRLTRILDGLVEKGVVVREISHQDRRVVRVKLTDRGGDIRASLTERYVSTHQDILNLLPEGTIEGVITAMEKLAGAMQEWSGAFSKVAIPFPIQQNSGYVPR